MTDAPDTRAVSIITDHAFEPRTGEVRITIGRIAPALDREVTLTYEDAFLPPNPYLCAHCRLAEAAHLDTTVTREEKR